MVANGNISLSVSIQIRKNLEHPIPIIERTKPLIMLSNIDVWTDELISRCFLEPKSFATITLAPTERPTKRLIIRLMSELVAPTAPIESGPSNLETTIKSAALNNSCRIPWPIKGKEKSRIFFNVEP